MVAKSVTAGQDGRKQPIDRTECRTVPCSSFSKEWSSSGYVSPMREDEALTALRVEGIGRKIG